MGLTEEELREEEAKEAARRERIKAAMARGAARGTWEPYEPKRKKVQREHPLERDEQKAVRKWLKSKGYDSFAVPNQFSPSMRGLCGRCTSVMGRNRKIHMANLKSEGVQSGIPDLVVRELAPCDGRPVMIEMKRVREARPTVSPEQREKHAEYSAVGWHVLVGYGAEDAVDQLKQLGY